MERQDRQQPAVVNGYLIVRLKPFTLIRGDGTLLEVPAQTVPADQADNAIIVTVREGGTR